MIATAPRKHSESWRAAAFLNHPDVAAWSFTQAHAEQLEQQCPDIDCQVCHDREDFHEALATAHIALVWRFSDKELALAPHLRILATPAAGEDYFHVDLPPGVAKFHGEFHGEIMSETAAAMVLAMSRGLLPSATTYAAHAWPRRELASRMRVVRGSQVLILGFGNIGAAIARSLKPFGVHLTGVKRTVEPGSEPDFFDSDDKLCPVEQLDSLLPRTDHLVMVLPATAETDRIMDARRLALLPDHATITNLGRGNAIDEGALVQALREGSLSGACLDVFDQEPLPMDSPLRSCVNLWRMPHASAIAPEYLTLFVDDFAEQFRRWKAAES